MWPKDSKFVQIQIQDTYQKPEDYNKNCVNHQRRPQTFTLRSVSLRDTKGQLISEQISDVLNSKNFC